MRYSMITLLLLFISIQCFGNPLPDKPHVYVVGFGEVEVEPDIMTIKVGIEAKDKVMKTAKADVDDRSNRLINSCINMGIERRDISSTTLQIRPDYEYHDNRRVFSGTIVSRQIEITLKDLKNYPDIMMSLVESKVTETLDTTLSVSNGKSLGDKALVKALADAKLQAEMIALASGKELGDVHSVSEFDTRLDERIQLIPGRSIAGQPQRIPGISARAAAASRNEPFEPGLISVFTTVYVVYLLE